MVTLLRFSRRDQVFFLLGIALATVLYGGTLVRHSYAAIPDAKRPGSTCVIAPSPTDKHYKVGQIVNTEGKWLISITKVFTTPGSDFDKPKPGMKYVVVEMTAKNITPKVQYFNPIEFTLSDQAGQKYTIAIVTPASPGVENIPGGNLPAGRVTKGTIEYEVPSGLHDFNYDYDGIFPDSAIFTWDLKA